MKRKHILILEGTVFHKYFSHIPFLTFKKIKGKENDHLTGNKKINKVHPLI